MRVLVVEDDRMIGEEVERGLRRESYAADWVRDGAAAIFALDTQNYDLMLLDLGLPQKSGHEVLAHLRKGAGGIAVLIITARDSLDERIQGLDGGADDYVTKPFEMAELLARMRAVVRRKTGAPHPVLSNGSLKLDPATREAQYEGRSMLLTGREFAVLRALMTRPGAILSRAELE